MKALVAWAIFYDGTVATHSVIIDYRDVEKVEKDLRDAFGGGGVGLFISITFLEKTR